MRSLLIGSLAVLGLLACGPRPSATTWGYSHWYDRSGGSSLGSFEAAQRRCLDQAGLTAESQVAPNSPEENAYLECMNAANWCTQAFACEKPGA